MKFLDLYYRVKPAIPHELRLKLRSYIASRQRCRSANVWPINESAIQRPDWWCGWPGGKRFAFVLTHDVEGRKGMERCRALAQLEIDLGFRSSFNFVPEGEYDTPAALRSYLTDHGFEVGVHDLHHDGSLYRSKAEFIAGAERINEHLERWQAVGFRSAFMFHNLEWLKELDVLYDASTFDTDPFEPQSDGAATIFPFWVERSDGSGYVELPYSLPQDSTLYLVLGEKTNEIWKHKLEWIAKHGGMALVNVHPDYTAFGERAGRTEFPVKLYKEFLAHVTAQFGDDAWYTLPRNVAAFVKESVAGTPTGAAKASSVSKKWNS
jgi:hypothetical protein